MLMCVGQNMINFDKSSGAMPSPIPTVRLGFLMLVENMARLVNLSVCKIVNMLVILLLCCTNFTQKRDYFACSTKQTRFKKKTL